MSDTFDTELLWGSWSVFATTSFLQDNFRDPDGVVGLIGQHWPESPKRETVRKWFDRGSVSGEWWPVLLVVLERAENRPVQMAQYAHQGEVNDVFA